MNSDPDRFKRSVVDILARRAANRCSNPDCRAITSGPAIDIDKSITVGEAAHIYGAKIGSARHDPSMSAGERSAITNAIWLCCNCHKLVDTNFQKFPANLLFIWRQEHENYVSDNIGKTGDRLRLKQINEELEKFQRTSYLARQIVIDKPYAWEYRLTAELLKLKLNPILHRGKSLLKGLYTKPLNRIPYEEAFEWLQDRLNEISDLVPTLTEITNNEFLEAWGAPGCSGSSERIIETCCLFEEACDQLLAWEERLRFTSVPTEFDPLRKLLCGIGIRMLNQVGAIPTEMGKIFVEEEPKGKFDISIVIDSPEGWSEKCHSELERIAQTLIRQ